MRRAARIAAIVLAVTLGLVALYAAVGFWAVPRLLAWQLERLAAEKLSLDAKVADVSFDPFRLRLVVKGLSAGPPGSEPTASLDELRLDVDAPALLARRLVVQELALTGPFVELGLGHEGLVVAGAAPGAEPAAEEAGAPAAGKAPAGGSALAGLVVERLDLTGGRVRFVDSQLQPSVTREIGPVDLQARMLDLSGLLQTRVTSSRSAPTVLRVDLGDGAGLTVQGDLDVAPLRLDLQLGLTALPLASLQPWLSPFTRLALRDGRLGLEGSLRMGQDDPGGVRFDGSADVSSLKVGEVGAPEDAAPLLAWKSLEVKDVHVGGEPLQVRIGEVDLAAPAVDVVRRDAGLNWALALAPARAAPAGGASAPKEGPRAGGSGPPVEIGSLRIQDGRVGFRDDTIRPAYHVALEQLGLKVDGFTTDPAGRSSVDLAARLDGYAPVHVAGKLEPLAPSELLDLAASIRGIELSSLSPYAGRYLGRELSGGRGSLKVDVKVDQRHVVGSNELVLESVDFGKTVASPDATSLPVATAALLLADADGRISLDLPVEGDLDDPGFSYTGTLVDTLRGLVTRVVQTPFKMVGGMVALGGKLFAPEDLRQVWFPAGRDALEEDEVAKLDALAKALGSSVAIEVRGGAASVDGSQDRNVLARRRAEKVREALVAAGLDPDRIAIGDVNADAKVRDGKVQTRLGLR